jgi:tetratricopeptide (TPR) repeat protein
MKIFFNICMTIIIGTACGCSNFLNEQVKAGYPDDAFYKTAAQAELAVNAAYQPLSFSNDQNRLWVFGDVASDDADKGGNPGDQADIGNIDDFVQIYPINGNIESVWGIYYEGITRCNKILQQVPAISMDKVLQNRILGEAHFLRAYYYFYLVNIFGPVPLILEPKNAQELQIPQSPVAEIYANAIEADCKSAITLLPALQTDAEVGRATKGAATALLAKAYLYQKKWQEAATTAALVQPLGNYALMPVFTDNFNEKFKNNAESIFAVQHLTNQVPFLGNRLNQWFAPRTESGYYFDVPTQRFVDAFEVTAAGIPDPRLDYSVGRKGQPWLDGEAFDPEWSPTGFLQKKNLQPVSEIPKSIKGNGNLNYVAIRYADVLLWQAEALNELGKPEEALKYLNLIRKRARESYLFDKNLKGFGTIPKGLLADITITSQSGLRDIIHKERRTELGFEFHRFFDLMRWGKEEATNALRDKESFNYETNRYFPIPQSERDTNKSLTP